EDWLAETAGRLRQPDETRKHPVKTFTQLERAGHGPHGSAHGGFVAMLLCPECAGGIDVSGDARVGEVIECPECLVQLEIISLDPVELALAPEVEEDWGE